MRWNISAWSIRNPVPAILLFIVLVALGLMSFAKLPVTRFPNIDVQSVGYQNRTDDIDQFDIGGIDRGLRRCDPGKRDLKRSPRNRTSAAAASPDHDRPSLGPKAVRSVGEIPQAGIVAADDQSAGGAPQQQKRPAMAGRRLAQGLLSRQAEARGFEVVEGHSGCRNALSGSRSGVHDRRCAVDIRLHQCVQSRSRA